MHKHIDARSHTRTHTRTHTDSHTHIHTQTHTHSHTYIHTHTHMERTLSAVCATPSSSGRPFSSLPRLRLDEALDEAFWVRDLTLFETPL